MDQFDDKEIQIGKQVLHEDDLVINVSYKGEQFALRYPDPGIETAIQTEVARRLGGSDPIILLNWKLWSQSTFCIYRKSARSGLEAGLSRATTRS